MYSVIRGKAKKVTYLNKRGAEAIDTGAPISVPVGTATLGRIFNVLGEPVDELGPVAQETTLPIHRSAPAFTQLETQPSIFETGIKVVDLLAPYRRGGKIGLFGGAGVGKTVLIMELIVRHRSYFYQKHRLSLEVGYLKSHFLSTSWMNGIKSYLVRIA